MLQIMAYICQQFRSRHPTQCRPVPPVQNIEFLELSALTLHFLVQVFLLRRRILRELSPRRQFFPLTESQHIEILGKYLCYILSLFIRFTQVILLCLSITCPLLSLVVPAHNLP